MGCMRPRVQVSPARLKEEIRDLRAKFIHIVERQKNDGPFHGPPMLSLCCLRSFIDDLPAVFDPSELFVHRSLPWGIGAGRPFRDHGAKRVEEHGTLPHDS